MSLRYTEIVQISFLASAASFTLEVLDKPHSSKKKQSVTKILFQTKFNNIIKYGQSVVFFSNVTAPLAAGFKRIIRVTPHIPMKICEIEAASNGKSILNWHKMFVNFQLLL